MRRKMEQGPAARFPRSGHLHPLPGVTEPPPTSHDGVTTHDKPTRFLIQELLLSCCLLSTAGDVCNLCPSSSGTAPSWALRRLEQAPPGLWVSVEQDQGRPRAFQRLSLSTGPEGPHQGQLSSKGCPAARGKSQLLQTGNRDFALAGR